MGSLPNSQLPDPRAPLHFDFKGPIYRAFREQVEQRPHASALISRHESCTYAELDEISNRLASCLQQQGIQRGHVVVLFSDRNPALVYGMLGVLKSGAAF